VKIAKVIWMKFNLFQGYDCFRWTKCMNNPDWWEKRAATMRRYVIPNLQNLRDQDWVLYAPFMQEILDKGIAQPVLDVLKAVPHVITTDKMETMRRNYRGKCDFLIQLWQDSDDMYREDVWDHIVRQPQQGMRCYVFRDGYCLDTRNYKLYRWLSKGCPPAFFAYTFTAKSLETYDLFYRYGRKAGYHKAHHELEKCRRHVIMPNNLYCGTMSGANTTKDLGWNRVARRHCGREIEDERTKKSILQEFGVAL